jgi:hypothetical protein
MKKSWFIVVVFVITQIGQLASAQRIEGFLQTGFSQGFSILAAMQISLDLAPQFRAGVRTELLYADGNNDTMDNPKLEIQPFIEFNQGIYQDNNFNAGFNIILRPYFRVFSSIKGGAYGIDFDLSTRIQAGINLSYRIDAALGIYGGFGFGTQLGIFPLPSNIILYNFFYSYFFAQYDLGSLVTPGLTAIIGGSAAPGIDSAFNIGGFGYGAYGALEYNLSNQIGFRFQLGYTSGRSYAGWDTPEANGFYVFLRASLR